MSEWIKGTCYTIVLIVGVVLIVHSQGGDLGTMGAIGLGVLAGAAGSWMARVEK